MPQTDHPLSDDVDTIINKQLTPQLLLSARSVYSNTTFMDHLSYLTEETMQNSLG